MNLEKGGKPGKVPKALAELKEIERLSDLVKNLDLLSDCIYETTEKIKTTVHVLDLPNLQHLKGEYKKKLQTVSNELFTLYENVSTSIINQTELLKSAKELKHSFEITGRARECTIVK
jgi:hypothetical protein